MFFDSEEEKSDVFQIARDLNAIEHQPTLAKLATKYKCMKEIGRRYGDERTLDEINEEERALFDRAEARAISSGAW